MALGKLGATASAVIWTIGSLLFSYYISRFAQFNPLFGSMGAVIIFFLWSYLTVLTILLGAQVNAEMERQTDIDATGQGNGPHASKVPQMDTPRARGRGTSRTWQGTKAKRRTES